MCAGYYPNSCYAFRICTIVRKQFKFLESLPTTDGVDVVLFMHCVVFSFFLPQHALHEKRHSEVILEEAELSDV